jgi:hypothetical protein
LRIQQRAMLQIRYPGSAVHHSFWPLGIDIASQPCSNNSHDDQSIAGFRTATRLGTRFESFQFAGN